MSNEQVNGGMNQTNPEPGNPPRWKQIITVAGLTVLGITPWAQAQLPPLDPPPAVICPTWTAIATPTLFDLFWGTTPIRFPFQ